MAEDGPDRDRTGDLLTASQARSQLRYRPQANSNIVKERVGRVNRRYWSVESSDVGGAADLLRCESAPLENRRRLVHAGAAGEPHVRNLSRARD